MKTTTITREYDDEGRCIREIRVEHEVPDALPQPVYPNDWWRPQPGWWQYPIISYTTSSHTSLAPAEQIQRTRDYAKARYGEVR